MGSASTREKEGAIANLKEKKHFLGLVTAKRAAEGIEPGVWPVETFLALTLFLFPLTIGLLRGAEAWDISESWEEEPGPVEASSGVTTEHRSYHHYHYFIKIQIQQIFKFTQPAYSIANRGGLYNLQ